MINRRQTLGSLLSGAAVLAAPEAQAAAHKMLAEARTKLDAALARERGRLQASAATLGREIAEKALGRRLAS